MKSSGKNIELASFDSIFSTEETRQGGNQRIQQLPLSELVPFKDHPFRVVDDDRMKETVESIQEYGVLVPIIVRPMDDGSYEIVSGHRRKRACELAEVEEIPAIVRDLDDDEATIIMVVSNLQRENILPSERAKAYQMKLEAIRRRAGRPKKEEQENGGQFGHDFEAKKAREIIAEEAGDSPRNVQRFIRLNELSEPLRDKVDNGELGFTPAVELSFLKPQEQEWVERALDETQQTPSLSQAQRIKQESKEGMLKLDLPEIRETIRLLKNLTNNVNQMAKSLHEQGSIYETEIDDIRQRVDEIWSVFRKILARLDHADN